MNCSKCQSLRISTTIYNSKEVTRCLGCGFVKIKQVDRPDHSKSQVKPKLDGAKKANPPNAIDRWLWSHGMTAMSGADAVDAMEAEE